VIGVTGAKGTLGRLFCQHLTDCNVVFSDFKGDIRQQKDIESWVGGEPITHIVHFAAVVPVDVVNHNPVEAYDTNVSGTVNLLKTLQKKNIDSWLFYASSSHVYAASDKAITEEALTMPRNVYGRTKLAGEQACLDVAGASKHLKVCIGRIFSFYHESQVGPYLFPTIKKRLAEAKDGDDFELRGADSIRDFLRAEEVVDWIFKLWEKNAIGVFNIASGIPVKIRDFVQQMTDKKINIVAADEFSDCLLADISKLKGFFNVAK